MPTYGIAIDTTKCIGCHSCQVACQNQNGLPPEMSFNWIKELEEGKYPSFDKEFVPVQCNQCGNAPCMSVCPTDAIYRTPEGVIDVHRDRCIGCEDCIEACPYKVRVVDSDAGIVVKCWFCIDLVRSGGEPACVTTCPTQVRIFGDLDDPGSRISRFIAQHRPQPLRPDLDTKPRVFYKRS